jgi:16S rRNA A1518/A1519 N6-dimethyltransferase RsmA/KsgA/DIM1 with predicted DNA glycosylase/AP lyase activity
MNPNHDKLCGSPEWAQHIQEDVLPVVTAGVDLGGEMLEIGPGPGAATGWLCQRVARLTALERDETAAAKLAGKFPGVQVAVGMRPR